MAYWKRTGPVLAVAAVLACGLLVDTLDAEAHGRRGRRPVRAHGGFYLYGPSYHGPHLGFGFGPWGGDRVDVLTIAKMTGWGALELDVKPGRADVWVDGEHVGEARDLDGSPSYLWLEKGAHRLAVYKGGHRTFEETVQVERGVLKKLKVRLEPGDSIPPGPSAPPEARGENASE